MRAVLDGDDVPAFLDPIAIEMLAAARKAYTRVHGAAAQWANNGEEVLILPWLGQRKMRTLAGALNARRVPAELDGLAIVLKGRPETLEAVRQVKADPPNAAEIALQLQPKASEKYHLYLTEPLLDLEIASSVVDLEGFEEVLGGVIIALAEALENAEQS
jgi:ATP-dependent Lhr-like helicase